jgi:NhaP-type Na+/H+ or K+/H+ antiporter
MEAGVCVFAFVVVVFVTQSARFSKANVTGPVVFLVVGGLVGWTLVDAAVEGGSIRTLAEVALVLVLFHDAAELQPRQMRADASFTGRLLLVGLPLTIAGGYLLARVMFPEVGVWLALLLAAALAPTDAGLGAATVLNPVVPARVRRILNVESGLNDGFATPVVMVAVAAAVGSTGHSNGDGFVGAIEELAVGALVGVTLGYLAGRLVELARDRGWADTELLPIGTLAVPLLCYYGAHGLAGNGFIAAFVAGTAYAAAQNSVEDLHETVGLTGLTSTFLGYGVWMVFGIVVTSQAGALLRWQNLLYALVSLTALRMVPVALSLLRAGLRPQTVVFVGWFGPRGLASIIFGLIAYESLDADPAVTTVLGVIATTVVLSAVAHGLTASPWSTRYGLWAAREHPSLETAKAVEPLHRHGVSSLPVDLSDSPT